MTVSGGQDAGSEEENGQSSEAGSERVKGVVERIAEVEPPQSRRGRDDPPSEDPYAVNGLLLPIPSYVRRLIREHAQTA